MARTLVGIYPGIAKIIEQELDCVAVYGNTEKDSLKLVIFAHNLKKLGLESEEVAVTKIFCDPDAGRVMLKIGDVTRGDGAKIYRFSPVAAKHRYVHTSFVTPVLTLGLHYGSFPQYFPVEEYNQEEVSITFRCDPKVATALSKKYNLHAGLRIEDISKTLPRNFQVNGETIEKMQILLCLNLETDEQLEGILDHFCEATIRSQVLLGELCADEQEEVVLEA